MRSCHAAASPVMGEPRRGCLFGPCPVRRRGRRRSVRRGRRTRTRRRPSPVSTRERRTPNPAPFVARHRVVHVHDGEGRGCSSCAAVVATPQVATAALGMLGARFEDLAPVDDAAAIGAGDLHQQHPNPSRYCTRRHRDQLAGAARVARSMARLRRARSLTQRKQTPTSGCSLRWSRLPRTVRSPQHQQPGGV